MALALTRLSGAAGGLIFQAFETAPNSPAKRAAGAKILPFTHTTNTILSDSMKQISSSKQLVQCPVPRPHTEPALASRSILKQCPIKSSAPHRPAHTHHTYRMPWWRNEGAQMCRWSHEGRRPPTPPRTCRPPAPLRALACTVERSSHTQRQCRATRSDEERRRRTRGAGLVRRGSERGGSERGGRARTAPVAQRDGERDVIERKVLVPALAMPSAASHRLPRRPPRCPPRRSRSRSC